MHGYGYDANLKALADVRQGLQTSLEEHRACLREYRTRCRLTCRGVCPLCRRATELLGAAAENPLWEPFQPLREALPWWGWALLAGVAAGLAAGLVALAF